MAKSENNSRKNEEVKGANGKKGEKKKESKTKN